MKDKLQITLSPISDLRALDQGCQAYLLECEDEADLESWVQALSEHILFGKRHRNLAREGFFDR